MEKRKNNNGIIYVVISLLVALLVGGVGYAYSNSQTVNVSGGSTYNYNEAEQTVNSEEPSFGATVGGDFYTPVQFFDTVQPSVKSFCNIKINLAEKATTSIANPDDLGHWCNNTGKDVWIKNWFIDFKDPNDLFGSHFTVGTTTCATGNTINKDGLCSKSLTATTTATLLASTVVNTTTRSFISPHTQVTNGFFVAARPGTYYLDSSGATSTPFLLGSDVCLVAYSDRSGATTTDEATHGFAGYGNGYLCAETVITY